MANVERMRNSILKSFKSMEDAAELWDTHELADDRDLTQEDHCT
jgi:hypothetical protein